MQNYFEIPLTNLTYVFVEFYIRWHATLKRFHDESLNYSSKKEKPKDSKSGKINPDNKW